MKSSCCLPSPIFANFSLSFYHFGGCVLVSPLDFNLHFPGKEIESYLFLNLCIHFCKSNNSSFLTCFSIGLSLSLTDLKEFLTYAGYKSFVGCMYFKYLVERDGKLVA